MATLYVCGQKTRLASVHPCARAAHALDEAGIAYELTVAPGYRRIPWLRGAREEIRRISGQIGVPVLVADGDEVVSGSAEIVRWAAEHAGPTR